MPIKINSKIRPKHFMPIKVNSKSKNNIIVITKKAQRKGLKQSSVGNSLDPERMVPLLLSEGSLVC